MAFDGNIHSVAYSTKLSGCTCFSFIAEKDLDNGMLIAKGDLEEGEREIYKAAYDITKPAYLVLNPAWDYDDSTYSKKYDESYYFIKACKPFRGYELKPTKRYAVSSDICTDTLKAGDFVVAKADGTLSKAASETNAGNAFVGKVVAVTNHGFPYAVGSAGTVNTTSKYYVVEVIKNETVTVAASGK